MSSLEPSTSVKDHVHAPALALEELALRFAVARDAPPREVEVVSSPMRRPRGSAPSRHHCVARPAEGYGLPSVSNSCNPPRPAPPLLAAEKQRRSTRATG